MYSAISPAKYWRSSKQWKNWIGRRGTVVTSTVVRVASSGFEDMVPYPFLLVDFGDTKREVIGSGKEEFSPGDAVVCVLRKMQKSLPDGIVSYGVKVILEKEVKQFA